MTFSPIAIVGRACVLPGALSPAQLWQAVAEGRDLLSQVPDARWQIDPAAVLCSADSANPDRTWSDRGGYVQGFEDVWDANGFAIAATEFDGLAPLVAWTLHCAREAQRECHVDADQRVGAVFGNLGFPSERMAAFAEGVWRGDGHQNDEVDSRNRHMSSGTADLLRRALALNAGSYCIDAACASSLYAIKLACDRLQEGSADLMLAGAVQGADDLFLHVGFCALGALSRSGQSRPFHRDADGLLPAEGAAFVALKRLADARRDGDVIHGVIRGIGLSNDGRGKGLLAPAEEGQRRAMQAAYAAAGFGPERIGLLECHATGTPVGDATEIASSAAVFAGLDQVPIGSLKSNLGHLITVAGTAGLIKVLEAMQAGLRPPTLNAETPSPALQPSPFRLLHAIEDWPSEQPRIAAISAFGFGGNNAHLIVSQDDPNLDPEQNSAAAMRPSVRLAIVGLGVMAANAGNREAFREAMQADRHWLDARGEGRMTDIRVDTEGLRFPPHDMAQTLPQQLAILQASREAMADTGPLPRERTGVFIGMEPDPEVARYGARWRLAQPGVDPSWLTRAREAIVPALSSAAVLGTMPNIPANRLSALFDLAGPAFTVQAGAASGLQCLRIAARALARDELDAALVGAVDLGCEPVQRAVGAKPPGDAAVCLVIKRFDDARRNGDRVYACFDIDATTDSADDATIALRFGDGGVDLGERFGTAPAASDLLHVAAAALCLQQRCGLDGAPLLHIAAMQAQMRWADGQCLRLTSVAHSQGLAREPEARLRCFAATDKAGVIAALRAGNESLDGNARLVLVADDARFEELREKALAHLERGAPAGANVFFCERPVVGEIAFVFAGAGASYHGMGRSLLQHLPQLRDGLAKRSQRLPSALAWAFADPQRQPSALEQLWGASALSQLHLELSQGLLGLKADAWLGYSSGETNALVASGTWQDPDALMTEMEVSGLVTHALGGDFAAIERVWQQPVSWASWTVLAPLSEVQAVIANEPRVHVAIINSDNDCLIAGDEAACARVVSQFGESRCLRLVYPLAVHVPELAEVAEEWLQLHRRHTRVPSGRIYSNALGRAYVPDRERCAEAILAQADRTLDLRPAVLAAWNDGVRVFIEHGPGGAYGRAIRNILGEREALVVSLDRKGQGFEATLSAIAALLAAGVPVRHGPFTAARRPQSSRVQSFPAHPPLIRWPALPTKDHMSLRNNAPQTMTPAPALPSVFSRAGIARMTPVAAKPSTTSPSPSPRIITELGADLVGEQKMATEQPLPTDTPPIAHPWLAQYQAHIAQLASCQRAFFEQQAQTHQRYLALKHEAMQVLLRAAANAPAHVPAHAQEIAVVHAGTQPGPVPPQSPPPTATADSVEPPPTRPDAVGDNAVSDIQRQPCGPQFSREQLVVHAAGRISTIFGPTFAGQDHFLRQVRMPMPPLLLADRVIGLDAVADSMGTGVIWTETDVCRDSWYLHQGYMPAGVLIEAGQADLMLISWLGVDRLNRDERVYRLLGCELTYHGNLPRAGDTVRFEITLDGHAALDDVRLMFFHYDGMNGDRRQLSVRKGEAGFFSDAELADSAGCLWSPEQQSIVAVPRLDLPAVARIPSQLSRKQLQALAAGDAFACFGEGYEFSQTHTRTPGLPPGQMLLLDRVSDLSANGGPWARGYLRAELDIDPGQWFFDGHFKNDPCMPGTLMFEGCLQALAIYLIAMGHGLVRDGWRFQPVPELPYQLQCRGQVTPRSRLLVTEIFVEEIVAGPIPTVYADLLCTVDGLKAFHARRVALQLVPDWPLCAMPALREQAARQTALETGPVASVDGFAFDQNSLLACAFGRPSDAFGPIYRRFDGTQRVARLPSPPYLFMSRISEVHGEIGVMKAGARVVAEYDVPADAWYFDRNGVRTMPFAVLLEAALQPCGWLSSYVGSALTEDGELGFRNLDGEGHLSEEIFEDRGTLTTEVTLTDVSATGGMIIENFSVRCRLGSREIYRLETVFGFFPPAALANQAGLRTDAAQREFLERESNLVIDLAGVPGDASGHVATDDRLKMADGMLLMIDRIDGHWPDAGAAGLGQLRAVKDIDCSAWFFKAHFFQDPVQPGSLGLEAMLQALQFHMLHTGMDQGIIEPRFEPIALQRRHVWKYRGQVLPKHRRVHTTLEIIETGRDAHGVYALADASLWADGQRIYEMAGVGMRIVSGSLGSGQY